LVTDSTPVTDQVHVSQIHLAIGGEGSRDMIVTFRIDGASEAKVCWGSQGILNNTATIRRKVSYWSGTYCSALLSPLEAKKRYSYAIANNEKSCADAVYLSTIRHFSAPPTQEDEVNVIIFGDLGYGEIGHAVESRRLLETLKKDADAVIHAGDISYADDSFWSRPGEWRHFSYEKVYDQWMNWMENVTDQLPYMVAVGNHESECHSPACTISPKKRHRLGNFSAYNARWHMPSTESGGVLSMWYSFNLGAAHFVSINTETDFKGAPLEHYGDCKECMIPAGSFGRMGEYLEWLEQDLKKANENRNERPWIIAYGHRPVYLTNGSSEPSRKHFEDIFRRYKVDAYISGHKHIYSRLKPKDDDVHYFVVGCAGSDERDAGDLKDYQGSNSKWDYKVYGMQTSLGKMRISRSSITVDIVESANHTVIDHVVMNREENSWLKQLEKVFLN